MEHDMAKSVRAVKESDLQSISASIRSLRLIAANLHDSGAPKAAKAVRRAIKSVEGAYRHADGAYSRQARQEGAIVG